MTSFGEDLRRERELREISLREVSDATKINFRFLEALEHNDFAHLPGGLFNRGFVRAYAQYIGVDPEAMVNAYLLEEQAQSGRADPPAGLLRRTSRRGEAKPEGRPAPRKGRRRFVVVLVAIFVALVVLGLGYLLATGAWPS